jgi:hypothetical protein
VLLARTDMVACFVLILSRTSAPVVTLKRPIRSAAKTVAAPQQVAPQKRQKIEISGEEPEEVGGDSGAEKSSIGQHTPVSPSGVIGKSRVGVNENTSGGALKLGVDFGIALVGILSKICPSVLIAAMSCGLQIGVALVGRYWLEVSSKQACCALWRDQLARRGMRRVLSLLS